MTHRLIQENIHHLQHLDDVGAVIYGLQGRDSFYLYPGELGALSQD